MGEKKLVLYSNLFGGFSDEVPLSAQAPGQPFPPFRDMQNLIWSQGVLKPGWKWTALDDTIYTAPTLDGNIASRQETALTNAQYVVGGAFISTSSTNQKACIIITDREVFVNGVTKNPSTTIAFAGFGLNNSGQPTTNQYATSIEDYEISPTYKGLKVSDVVHLIGDYGLDAKGIVFDRTGEIGVILDTGETDWNGTFAGGSESITIRRTFHTGTLPGKVHWAILNGDLFVACQGAGVDPGGTSGWCVLKIADIYGQTAEATYQMATWDVTGAMADNQILPNIDEITGLVATPDGRLLISCKEDGIGNRIRHSSHLDNAIWDNEVASFVDQATATAEIRCLTKLDERMVAFFEDSIFVGDPTGLQHQPYTWRRSRAMVGTRWYRAAAETPRGIAYVGSDGNFWLFNGETSEKLTDETIRKYINGPDQLWLQGANVDTLIANATASAVAPTVNIA